MSKSVNDVSLASGARLIAHMRVPLYRNAYALMFSSITTSSLGMVYWLLAARYYTAEVVGLNSAALGALMFLTGVSGLYLDGALIRFIPRAGWATGRLVGYAYLIGVIVAAFVSLIFLLGLGIWVPALAFLSTSPWWMLGFMLATMASCIFTLEDGALTGLRQTMWVPVENTTHAVAKLVLLIICAAALPRYGIFISWIIPIVILILPVNFLIFRRLIPQYKQATEDLTTSVVPSQILKYVAGNYLASLFNITATRLLPVMVIQQAGSGASAYFYLPWVITSTLQLVTLNMSQSLIVEGAIDGTTLGVYGRQALVHMARLLVPAVAILLIGAPYILHVFGNSYAAEGTTLLRLLGLAVIPNIVCILYIGFACVQQHIGRVALVQGSLAALVLGLSSVLLGRYGINGVGLAWLASQSIVAVILLLTQLRAVLRPVRQ
jgi:O-antigen/teichoic acid export membrane protein